MEGRKFSSDRIIFYPKKILLGWNQLIKGNIHLYDMLETSDDELYNFLVQSSAKLRCQLKLHQIECLV